MCSKHTVSKCISPVIVITTKRSNTTESHLTSHYNFHQRPKLNTNKLHPKNINPPILIRIHPAKPKVATEFCPLFEPIKTFHFSRKTFKYANCVCSLCQCSVCVSTTTNSISFSPFLLQNGLMWSQKPRQLFNGASHGIWLLGGEGRGRFLHLGVQRLLLTHDTTFEHKTDDGCKYILVMKSKPPILMSTAVYGICSAIRQSLEELTVFENVVEDTIHLMCWPFARIKPFESRLTQFANASWPISPKINLLVKGNGQDYKIKRHSHHALDRRQIAFFFHHSKDISSKSTISY